MSSLSRYPRFYNVPMQTRINPTIQRFVDRVTSTSRIELCIPKLRTSTKLLVEVSLHCRRLWRSYSPREAVAWGRGSREASSSEHTILASENDRSDQVYPFLKLQFQSSRATARWCNVSSELQPRAATMVLWSTGVPARFSGDRKVDCITLHFSSTG